MASTGVTPIPALKRTTGRSPSCNVKLEASKNLAVLVGL